MKPALTWGALALLLLSPLAAAKPIAFARGKTVLQETGHSSNRVDTLQLGWAPYAHEYDTLATWIVVQGRNYTGGIYDGTETALLLRLFKGGTWVEAGVTADRKFQAMAMFNF